MKLLKYTQSFVALVAIAGFMSSCEKVKSPTPLGDNGQTVVKLIDGGQPGKRTFAIDFVARPTTLTLADLRRDVSSEAELNRTMKVTVIDDTAVLRAYNVANNANLIYLPASFYSIKPSTPKVGGTGGVFNVVMNPGEYAKPIDIVIPDATVLNPSAKYGLAFTITAVDADGVISTAKTVVVEVGAKNIYDGIYSIVSGTVTRYTSPGVPAGDALSGDLAGNRDIHLATISANACRIPIPGEVGALGWAFGSNSNVAGIDGTTVTVDPSTNLVTMASAGNATLTNWAGRTNNYVPATKTFNLAFRWNPTGATREYQVVLLYKAPR